MNKFLLSILFIYIYSCTVSPRYNAGTNTNQKKNNSYIKNKSVKTGSNKIDKTKKIYNGVSSWYGPNFHGKLTANGEIFDMYGLTAAHKTLPLNTIIRVTNIDNNKSIILRINDRGPFIAGRMLDCSMGAAKKLGFYSLGTANVRLEVIDWGDNEYMQH